VPDHAKRADPSGVSRKLMQLLWGSGELEMPDTDGTKLLEHVADELDPHAVR
jgi:hypothetical protein